MPKPVRTAHTDLLLTGPPGTGDLPVHVAVEQAALMSVWWLSPGERQAIAEGANLVLFVHTAQHPPVTLAVVTDEPGLGDDAPDVLERLWHLQAEGLAHG